jgi:hypothetical protein
MHSISRGAMETADGLQLLNWLSSQSETRKPKLEFLTNQIPLFVSTNILLIFHVFPNSIYRLMFV